MAVLVTGGAGFIGRRLVSHLCAEGHDVRVLDRRPGPRKATCLVGDVRDAAVVREALDGVDRVVHLAGGGDARRSVDEPTELLDVYLRGTAVLLQEAERASVDSLVFASSAHVFGDTGLTAPGPQARRRPVSPYGAAVLGAEGLMEAAAATTSIRLGVARLSTVYGPHQPDHQAIARFLHALRRGHPLTWFGDGTATRDHLHVDDAVRALLVAEDVATRGDVAWVHGATGRPTSHRQLLALLQQITGRQPELDMQHPQPGDPAHLLLQPAQFAAHIQLRQGLEQLWAAET
jgi:UDP-glucose 4-epimerase